MTVEKAGIGLAIAYVLLQPLMLQNPLEPILPGSLGALQLADVLLPFMLVWVALRLWTAARAGRLRDCTMQHRAVLVAAAAFLAACLLAGAGADESATAWTIAKYAYLLGVLVFFVIALSSDRASLLVFRAVVYISIAYMILSLGFYVAALVFEYSSDFAQIRDNFPYLGRVVRLNGPMQPTAKIFGAYMLLLSLLLMLGRNLIGRGVWRFGVALCVLCACLTLGRVGIVAAAAVVLGLAALSVNRQRWLGLLAAPVLFAAVAIQLATVWHLDASAVAWNCEAEYLVAHQTQYFGWHGEPTLCEVSLRGGITYSSYFLMKLVAWNSWLTHPMFGIGLGRYVEAWQSVAGLDIPSFFVDYPFALAQSTYLTLLAEAGAVGFSAWICLIAALLVSTWKARSENAASRWVLLTWLACFAYAMIDLDVHNFRFLYVFLPLASAIALRDRHSPGRARPRPGMEPGSST